MAKPVIVIANGDLRLSANRVCWPAQERLEQALFHAIQQLGFEAKRGHAFDPEKQHGFIDSQKRGIEVFRNIPEDAPLIVAEAVWQYSHNVLAGLASHRGPILTVANWSGQWPGLVGMLNLNGSLAKAGVAYATLWSEKFDDKFFLDGLREWLHTGRVTHNRQHVHPLAVERLPQAES